MDKVKKLNIKNTTSLTGYDERAIGAEAYNVDVGLTEDYQIVTDPTTQTAVDSISAALEFKILNSNQDNILKMLDDKAQKNHASSTNEYGAATFSNYGHVKLGRGLTLAEEGNTEVVYGTGENTACRGDDSRLSDDRKNPNMVTFTDGIANVTYDGSAARTITCDTVGAAAKNHASTATTYGVGTSANYGHVKISDDTTSAASDQALSTVGAKAIQTSIDNLKITNYDKQDVIVVNYGLSTDDGSATIEEACKEFMDHIESSKLVGLFMGVIELDLSVQCPVIGGAGNVLFEVKDNSNFICCCQGAYYTFGYVAGVWFFNKMVTNTDHDFTITTDWLDNTSYGDYTNYPYYQIISTDIYSDNSFPVCLILAGTPSSFMTETERDCKGYISDEIQFSSTGIVILATDKTTTNLTLRVKGV